MLRRADHRHRGLGRRRGQLRRATPDRVQGLVAGRWPSISLRSRTAPRSSASGRPRSARASPTPSSRSRARRSRAALDDAGIAPSEVDGLASFTMEHDREVDVARNVGLGDITFFSQVGYGGGAGVRHGRPRRDGGRDRSVRGRGRVAGPQARRQGEPAVGAGRRDASTGHRQWSRPFGLLRPVDEIAMLTRRYMHEYGATRDHLANVALAFRKHANRNPDATMYDEAADPRAVHGRALDLRAAVPVRQLPRDRRRARGRDHVAPSGPRDLPHKPVYVHSFAQGIPPQHQMMTNYFNDDPLRGPAWACGAAPVARRRLHARRRRRSRSSTTRSARSIPLSLEGYGFCERGEGGAFTDDGALEWPDGRLPDEHRGRRDVRGVRARLQPRARGRAPDARHVDEPGRRAPSPAS